MNEETVRTPTANELWWQRLSLKMVPRQLRLTLGPIGWIVLAVFSRQP